MPFDLPALFHDVGLIEKLIFIIRSQLKRSILHMLELVGSMIVRVLTIDNLLLPIGVIRIAS